MADTKKSKQNFLRSVPPGDNIERSICANCDFIDYQNPKIVVGSVATWEGKVLLCRRAIEPRTGYWTLPAGYMELGETAEDGALREAMEEACAKLEIDRLLAVYSVPRISQVQLMFRARLVSPKVAPGLESQEVQLFEWDDIPWPDLAFPTVGWALRHFNETRGMNEFAPFSNPVDGL